MAKDKKNKKEGISENRLNVHPVVEAGVIVVKILVLFTAAIVFIVSIMANAEWYAIGLRTAMAMISVGFLGWFANWILGKWVLAYELNKYEEEQNQED